ncbi:FAD/NAD(P)-binding protein [Leucobacter chinensis]|uniref:FAD/NAD(P)-binding protein n=1 Tax=Leucobacter chinensis TaxID=2851010 RepID=UPI001C21EE94|nr:FAD/NAD(P)-binding protein [Leucobacter chinensis]
MRPVQREVALGNPPTIEPEDWDLNPPVDVVCVGAGPAAAMLLERIVASHARDTPELPLRIRLVDPYPPGGGRIWRRSQSPLLKLNSMLRDVAFFTDASCHIEGPVAPGPSLAEWVQGVREGEIPIPDGADELLLREIALIADDEFPTRRLNNAYLGWALTESLDRAEHSLRASWVADTVVAVDESRGSLGQHLVHLESGSTLAADVVVYALGHNGADLSADSASLTSFARRHGLTYVAPAFTADVDFSLIDAGADVIVRGMGLAAIDLAVLLAEGRGGVFTRATDGSLSYEPSGNEPVLHFASRRGVPYRSKITSQVVGAKVQLEYLGAQFHEAIASRTEPLDFDRDVWPLIAADLVTGYYRELFTGHPDRVLGDWDSFGPRLREILARGDRGEEALASLVQESVPDPRDRFDLASFEYPLRFAAHGEAKPNCAVSTGVSAEGSGGSARTVHERVRAHIVEDLRLRTQPENSATQALFLTGLYAFLSIAEVKPEQWNALSRTHSLPRRWANTFSYLASGPPGHRLEELVALADAGVVRFLGGDVVLEADETLGVFRAEGYAVTSEQQRAEVNARTLIDAWLPEAQAAVSDNTLLRRLVAQRTVHELTVVDERTGALATTGQIEARSDGSLPGSYRQFALGPFVAGLTGGAFTRPGLNSLPFRVHDRCSRAVLAAATAVYDEDNGAIQELVTSTGVGAA